MQGTPPGTLFLALFEPGFHCRGLHLLRLGTAGGGGGGSEGGAVHRDPTFSTSPQGWTLENFVQEVLFLSCTYEFLVVAVRIFEVVPVSCEVPQLFLLSSDLDSTALSQLYSFFRLRLLVSEPWPWDLRGGRR